MLARPWLQRWVRRLSIVLTGVAVLAQAPVGRCQALCPPGAGHSLRFDGIDDRVDCGDVFPGSNRPHTIEAWVRIFSPTSAASLIAGQHGVDCCGKGFGLWYWTTEPIGIAYYLDLAPCGGGGGWIVDRAPLLGSWHHYAGTWDGSEMRLYRDGQLVEAASYSQGYAGFSRFTIGASLWGVGCGGPAWTAFFPGDIDEVRLWDHARTQAEIQATMQVSLGGSEPGLVGYWPMDEGAGSTTADLGPGGHDGAISGVQWIASCVRAYCFGDGSGTACPCGNAGAGGNGCANGTFASGCNLSASGIPSVTGDTLALHAASSTPGQFGLFFQGNNEIQGGDGAVFGDGLRCAGVNVDRLELVLADGQGAAATSVAIAAAGNLSAGDLKRYQWWYRDPALSLCGTGFNLSNGIEVIWTP